MKISSYRSAAKFVVATLGLFILLLVNCPHRALAQTNTFPSSGNVGIGTTSPSDILHVAGGNLSTVRNEMSTWLANNTAGGALLNRSGSN
ncbi:MAG: hypothetical protein ABJB61_05720 [bacterium]